MFFLFSRLRLFRLRVYYIILDKVLFCELELLNLNSSLILITILIDWITLLFMRFVFFISGVVIYYSEEYMKGDIHINRFVLLIVIFVFSIMLLIVSPNLIRILLGWDGLGLVSYCLVIYYQNIKSYNAGILTALTNRIGDVALLISIAWILNFGRWNYIFYLQEFKDRSIMEIISVLVVLAGATKRAQIPFSSWLPAAIAAPTPVSSLVHSSTLVTAGVYLLIRFNFSFRSNLMFFILFISRITIFISGLGANFEFDLKKIIALSTLSQLGLIIRILFLGDYELAFFHLLTHALFKALLFMCAGNIIHNLNNCQDIRFIGGLVNRIPLTCVFFNIRNISLCGLPFLSGFYSKDLIVEVISINYLNIYIYIIFYLSIGLTVCYRFRLVYYVFLGNFNFISLRCLGEYNYVMLKGIRGLFILVVFMGRSLSWLIFSVPYVIILSLVIKTFTLILILLGIWVGFEVSKFSLSYSNFSLNYHNLSWFLGFMWNIPFLSTLGINFYPIIIGTVYYKNLDQGWLEYFGGQKIFFSLKSSSKGFQIIFNNNIKFYFILIVFWLIFIFFIYLNSLFRA